ncbi:hypothetical protein, partial [Curtobacterium sp. B18]|uniref:hypothetical protein n=1 Tax=Curtobacterium sp. B18 TaxID=95614 RepID=UPI0005B2D1FA
MIPKNLIHQVESATVRDRDGATVGKVTQVFPSDEDGGETAERTAASIRDDAATWRAAEVPVRARAASPGLDDDRALAAWEAAAWGMTSARPFATADDTTASPNRPGVPSPNRPGVPSPLRHRSRTVVAV